MPADTRGCVLEWLRPGRDGLLLVARSARGTFLPSVWAKLADPDAFLDHLLAKAGLPPHGWPADAKVWRYTTEEFGSPGPRDLSPPRLG
jgi:AMMECR1 domain-containing protein